MHYIPRRKVSVGNLRKQEARYGSCRGEIIRYQTIDNSAPELLGAWFEWEILEQMQRMSRETLYLIHILHEYYGFEHSSSAVGARNEGKLSLADAEHYLRRHGVHGERSERSLPYISRHLAGGNFRLCLTVQVHADGEYRVDVQSIDIAAMKSTFIDRYLQAQAQPQANPQAQAHLEGRGALTPCSNVCRMVHVQFKLPVRVSIVWYSVYKGGKSISSV